MCAQDANKDLKLQLASWHPEESAVNPEYMMVSTRSKAPRPPQRRLADEASRAAPAPAPGPAPGLPSTEIPAAGPSAATDDYRNRVQAAADRLASLENSANAALSAATVGAQWINACGCFVTTYEPLTWVACDRTVG